MRVAIIGAGASGLAATKCCLEAGFDPACFEAEADIGGLWRFTEEERNSSVYRSTIINTSKELMCFSDFPIPFERPEWPTFLHHSKVLKYFNLYVDHFGFRDRIRLCTRVLSVLGVPSPDGAATGLKFTKWRVRFARCGEGSEQVASAQPVEEEFDAVLVCVGHHCHPRMPSFPGAADFKGVQLHSHAYKDPAPFVDKRVCVVGIGNSAVDLAVELSRHASKTYLSTRRGAWVLSRLGLGGLALDYLNSRILFALPFSVQSLIVTAIHKLFFGDLGKFSKFIKPAHGVLAAHPTINGELLGKIATSEVLPKPNIRHLTAKGAVFEDSDEQVELDAVIYCTGYQMRFPFSPPEVNAFLKPEDNEMDLYKLVFPPEPSLRNFAFIGFVQPLGAVMPISEMQARWFCQVMLGNASLPTGTEIRRDIDIRKKKMQERYVASQRHTIQVDYVPYMNEIGALIGVVPSFWSYAFWRPFFALRLLFGPTFPAYYRLSGPFPWSGANRAIELSYESCFPSTKRSETSWSSFRTVRQFVIGFLLIFLAKFFFCRRLTK